MKRHFLFGLIALVMVACSEPVNTPASETHVDFDVETRVPDWAIPDRLTAQQDTNTTYNLPWKNGLTFSVTQGYNGSFSHQGIKALDFGMPDGTEIRAARGGTVALVVTGQGNVYPACVQSGYAGSYNGNYIVVQHDDGSRAYYLHLSSTSVAVNASVNRGATLGYSGNTGCSTGGHLHFQVYGSGSSTTIDTPFYEAGSGIAQQGVSYTSQNTGVVPPSSANCNPGWTPGGPWTRQISDNDLDLSEGQGFQKLGLYPQYWWADGSNGSGGNSVYTYSGNVADENFGKWSTYVPAGTYDAYAYIPTASGNGDNIGGSAAYADTVKYKVQGFDGPVYNVASINQSANRGCWVKLGSGYGFTQGLRVAVQLGDQVDSAAGRRIYYDDVAFYQTAVPPTPAAWALGPTNLTLPAGTVGGVASSATYSLTNTGQSNGNAALTASNGFALSQPSVGLAPSQKFDMTVGAPACTAVGTQTSTITATGNGNITSMNVTRVCSAAPTPTWTTNPTALTFTAYVGSTPANQTFTITNTGTGSGTFGMGSTNNALVTATGYNTTLAVGAPTTATVLVGACTSVGQTTAQLGIDGGGSSAAVGITRICNAAPIPAPTAPSPSSITMSSNGRIFIAWPEVSGATQYDFQATFGGAAISVTGQAPNRGGANGSAVATFLSAPDAADKQGKQVCFSMRASNTGGSSAFSGFACTTYKYYAGGLSVQSSSDVPRLTLK